MTATKAEEILGELRANGPIIGPSLLASDFTKLGCEIERLEEAGARWLHLDIMDGHLVPNISFGFPILEAVRRMTQLPLDVHLMISEPARYLKRFRDAGADLLTVHVEAITDPATGQFADPRPLLHQIRDLGAVAGLTLNPPTPLSSVEPYLGDCDLVLVMSVNAGFGGQKFHPEAVERIRRLRSLAGERLALSVDGGIDHRTIGPCAEAGANLFITGTALFSYDDYRQAIDEFRASAVSYRQN